MTQSAEEQPESHGYMPPWISIPLGFSSLILFYSQFHSSSISRWGKAPCTSQMIPIWEIIFASSYRLQKIAK